MEPDRKGVSRKDSVYVFALRYWLPQRGAIAFAAVCMLFATAASVLVPMAGKELASYGHPTGSVPQRGSAMGLGTRGVAQSITAKLGSLSEAAFVPLLSFLFHSLRGASADADGDAAFVEGLVCRCLLVVMVMIVYHTVSCVAHVAAHRAGSATQKHMVLDSVSVVLGTRHPERIAVANPVRVSQIISSSAKNCGDALAGLLTDMLSSLFSVVAILATLLYISARLTLLIGAMVSLIQVVCLLAGRRQDAVGNSLTSEEAATQAQLANAVQCSETAIVFDCRDFILGRLRTRLGRTETLSNRLAVSIHGFGAVSSAATRLVFVVVVGISNYMHRRGEIELMDIVLYFTFVSQFVGRLVRISNEANRLRSALARLQILKSMLDWYREDEEEGQESQSLVETSDKADAEVLLERVDYTYPELPAFFVGSEADSTNTALPTASAPSDGGALRGVRQMSIAAAPGKITVLFGPSGCGKSTCLRLLCGLVKPHSGTVCTHRRVVLLEQRHAIFIGTAAENISLQPLAPLSTELEKKVMRAAAASGCSSFLADPFTATIDNADHPPFSGGQLQRLCLARVFFDRDSTDDQSSCTLVLLDEPTTGLDAVSVGQLLQTIKELRDVHHKTVLISTHDYRLADVADKIIDLTPQL